MSSSMSHSYWSTCSQHATATRSTASWSSCLPWPTTPTTSRTKTDRRWALDFIWETLKSFISSKSMWDVSYTVALELECSSCTVVAEKLCKQCINIMQQLKNANALKPHWEDIAKAVIVITFCGWYVSTFLRACQPWNSLSGACCCGGVWAKWLQGVASNLIICREWVI